MLSVDDLTRMQATLADTLPETATIRARVLDADGIGGFTEQFVTVRTCAARIVAGSALTKEAAARLSTEVTHVIVLPVEVEVTPGDRLEIGGRTFHVIEGTVDQNWELARRVSVKEL